MRFLHIFSLVLASAFAANALLQGLDTETSSSRLARTRLVRHLPDTRPIDPVEKRSVRPSLHQSSTRVPSSVHVKNFQISDIYTNDFKNSATVWNRTISFLFTDPNSNTSTICTHSWTQSNTTSNFPTSNVLCDFTSKAKDYFFWKFDSLTSLGKFTIEFAHEFSDPAHYPAPYDVVEYFSQPTTFNLACTERSTSTGLFSSCVDAGPLPVVVRGIAN